MPNLILFSFAIVLFFSFWEQPHIATDLVLYLVCIRVLTWRGNKRHTLTILHTSNKPQECTSSPRAPQIDVYIKRNLMVMHIYTIVRKLHRPVKFVHMPI
jgi:hypothetical protein